MPTVTPFTPNPKKKEIQSPPFWPFLRLAVMKRKPWAIPFVVLCEQLTIIARDAFNMKCFIVKPHSDITLHRQRFFAWSNLHQAPEPSRPSVHFLVKSGFSKKTLLSQLSPNLPPSVCDHSWYLIGFLSRHHATGDVWSPSLSSARIPFGWFSQNPPYPWCFLFERETPPWSLVIN